MVSHLRNDVEISCLPKDLPEFLEVDISELGMNELKYLADTPVPEGVELTELTHGRNAPVVSVHHPKAEEVESADGRGGRRCAAAARLAAAAAALPRRPVPRAGAKRRDAKGGKDAKETKDVQEVTARIRAASRRAAPAGAARSLWNSDGRHSVADHCRARQSRDRNTG